MFLQVRKGAEFKFVNEVDDFGELHLEIQYENLMWTVRKPNVVHHKEMLSIMFDEIPQKQNIGK